MDVDLPKKNTDNGESVDANLISAQTETLLLQMQIGVLTPNRVTDTLSLNTIAQQILGFPENISLTNWCDDIEPVEYRPLIGKVEFEALPIALLKSDGRYIRAKMWQFLGIAGTWQIAIQVETHSETDQNPLDTDYFGQQQLLSIISHELRTPAATMRMLIEELETTSDIAFQLPLLKETSQHLMSVLEDMRQAINPEQNLPFKKVFFHPNRLIESVSAQLRRVAQSKGMVIRMVLIADEGIRVETDLERCKLILLNLIKNAIYHSHGKVITVKAEFAQNTKEEAKLTLSVEDDGIGIDQKELARLLQPFQRKDLLYKGGSGAGLGLFVTQQTLNELNGSFVINHPSKGLEVKCTLTCVFKLIDQEELRVISQESHTFQQRLLSMKVLVVEDDPVIRMVSQRLLSKRVGEVDVAENGEIGLKMLRTKEYDLILTDYYMPVMDGLQMIIEARKEGIKTPIISVTAAVLGKETVELREAGANEILAKPISMKAFIETVHALSV